MIIDAVFFAAVMTLPLILRQRKLTPVALLAFFLVAFSQFTLRWLVLPFVILLGAAWYDHELWTMTVMEAGVLIMYSLFRALEISGPFDLYLSCLIALAPALALGQMQTGVYVTYGATVLVIVMTFFAPLPVVMAGALLLSLTGTTLYAMGRMRRRLMETQRERDLFEKELAQRRLQYTEFKKAQDDLYRLAHDLRHLSHDVEPSLPSPVTANDTLNLMLNHAWPVIMERNISVIVNADNVKPDMPDDDYAVILGCLVDNAAEHCDSDTQRRMLIELWHDDQIHITLRNSLRPGQAIDITTSSKSEDGHGYGVKSVQELTKRHHGTVQFKRDACFFSAELTFPCKA